MTPAEPLAIDSDTIDTVVCQQGFQFFPNKAAAAEEIYRVLHNGGTIMVSTWCPVDECAVFGHLCNALQQIGEAELSDMIRVPFDYMPAEELQHVFEDRGFVEVSVEKQHLPFRIERGIDQAMEILNASPIGPKVRALTTEQRAHLQEAFASELSRYDGQPNKGNLVSNFLTARRIG